MKSTRLLETTVGAYTAGAVASLYVAGVGTKVLPLLVLASVGLRLLRGKPLKLSDVVEVPDWLVAVFLLLFIVLRIRSTSDILGGFVEGIVIYQALKWTGLETPRDAFILAGIAYVEVLASASATTSLGFLPPFIFVAVLTSVVLFLLYVHLESADHTSGGKQPRVSRAILTTIGAFGILSLIITAVIFASIPRLGFGMLRIKNFGSGEGIGFRSKVTLEEPAFYDNDSRVVARVISPPETAPPVYLKAITLSVFREGTWYRIEGTRRLPRAGSHSYVVSEVSRSGLSTYDVIQEPTGQKTLLLLPGTVEVRWKWGLLSSDTEGNLYAPVPITAPVKYTLVTGGTSPRKPGNPAPYLDTEGIPAEIKRVARVLGLTEGIPFREKVARIRSYLRKRCSYERAPWNTTLAEFIEGVKAGNCQHYATATALLLREAGIPARFVGGYASYEFNEMGGYWMFRQKDAHAWVEAYVPGKGWEIVDTTPSGPPERYEKMSHFLDWAREMWYEYVIGYDLEKQIAISREIAKNASRLNAGLRTHWRKAAAYLGGLAASLFLLSAVYLLWKRASVDRKSADEHPLYREIIVPILKEGEKLGIPPREGETLREYAKKLAKSGVPPFADTLEFVEIYEECRYGVPPAEKFILLREMRKAVIREMRENRADRSS